MRPSALALVTLAHAGLPCTHAKTWVVSGGDPDATDKADWSTRDLVCRTSRATASTSASASKLLKVVGLSEGVVADVAFARQVRRKYV
jgi:hypothetical protein